MNIQIKNIKVYEALSEETACATTDVFVDGKKIAYSKNVGHGGSTDYRVYKTEDRPILEAAEEFAKTLPSTIHKGAFGDLEIKSTLESIIEQAVYDFEQAKFTKAKERNARKFQLAMAKDMETAILIGKPNGNSYRIFPFKSKNKLRFVSITSLQTLIDHAKSHIKDGEVILNTNLADLQVTL